MRAFLGVDAGGSKTRALLIGSDGSLLGRGSAGAANFRTGSLAAASQQIGQAVDRAAKAARLPPGSGIDAAFIGTAGLEGPGEDELARQLLGRAAFSPRRVGLDSDAYIAWAGAFACSPGILVSAGTGSVGLAVLGAGERHYVGGWGPQFGDEGSAYAIAREAIRVALEIADGRRSSGMLLAALQEHSGLADHRGRVFSDVYREITRWLYATHRNQSDIAALAPRVHDAARHGDEAAKAILERAGSQLGDMALALARQYRSRRPGSRPKVATAGSVLRDNPFVRDAFLSRLESSVDDIGFVPAMFPPCAGAALLALAGPDSVPPTGVLERLRGEFAKQAV